MTDVHPADAQGRRREAQMTAELSQYLVPGLRTDDVRRLAEQGLDSDTLRALLFALQGSPGPEMPSGGA